MKLRWDLIGVALAGLTIAGYFVTVLASVQSDVAHNSTQIAGILVAASEARQSRAEGFKEMDQRFNLLSSDMSRLSLYIGDNIGHHRGEHGRIEGAADTLEGILRGLRDDAD